MDPLHAARLQIDNVHSESIDVDRLTAQDKQSVAVDVSVYLDVAVPDDQPVGVVNDEGLD